MGRHVDLSLFPRHPRFVPVRCLGHGGMGIVFEAIDGATASTVAVKTLRAHDPARVYRFKQEFRALRQILHPHLVRLFELFEGDDGLFFTMDLVRGVDLLTYLGQGRAHEGVTSDPHRSLETLADVDTADAAPTAVVATPPPDPPAMDATTVARVFLAVASGVHAIHAAGKIHRDIKPSNVLVDATGHPTILDFGLVIEGDDASQAPEDDRVVGTAAYMAPEQAAGERVGPAADWYAFGVMLYRALTGSLPLSGPPLVMLVEKQHLAAPDPRVLAPACPDALAELCQALLAVDLSRRPDAARIVRVLAELSGESPPPVGPAPSHESVAFVGRDRELDLIHRTFSESHPHRAAVVVLAGESGIGKSTLARHYLELERRRVPTTITLLGRCYEHEAVSFKALDGVIDALSHALCERARAGLEPLMPRDSTELVTLFPVLGRVPASEDAAPPKPAIRDPVEQRRRAFSALHELWGRLAAVAPVLVMIDDMQWCDADSVRLLADLLGRPNAPAVHFIFTARPFGMKFSPHLPCPVVEIDLHALTTDDALVLADRLVDAVASVDPERHAKLVHRLVEESAGHPFYMTEIARFLHESEGAATLRVRLDHVIAARVARLPDPARELLALVVLASAPISEDALALASGQRLSETQRHLDVLRVARLIRTRSGSFDARRIEPYHDRIRDAVVPRLDAALRQRLNGALADVLEHRVTSAVGREQAVYHLLQSNQSERSAKHALAAAERARTGLAFERAATFYEIALQHGRHAPSARREILVALGEVLVSAGRCPEAATAFERASEGADPLTALTCRIRVADQLVQSGRIEPGLALLHDLFAAQGDRVPRSTAHVALRILWHQARLRLRGLAWTPCDPTTIHPVAIARLELYRAASRGLMLIDPIRAGYFVLRGLHLALELGHPYFVPYFLILEATSRYAGSLERPERFARRAEAHYGDHSDPWLQSVRQAHEGARLYLRLDHRFDVALDKLVFAEQSLRRLPDAAWEVSMGRLLALYCLLDTGQYPSLRDHAQRYVRDAETRGNLYAQKTFRALASVVHLVEDDPATARQALDLDHWTSMHDGYQLPHWVELHARSQVCLYEGTSIDPAFLGRNLRALRRSLLLHVVGYAIDAAWLEGRIALARACPSVVPPRRVRRAIARLEHYGTDFSVALAQLLRAGVALQRGDRAQAAHSFARALERAEAARLQAVSAVAHDGLAACANPHERDMHAERAKETYRTLGIRAPHRFRLMLVPCPGGWPAA